ncbi:hypothetical protein OF83DRAFT_1180079 [Amylostereum chailletii]|nr:hypothetical protein OF83DRAFT_1180079 [Amylostereum chailletii]
MSRSAERPSRRATAVKEKEGVEPKSLSYRNYEARVVEAKGVYVVGWPCSVPWCNPGKLSRDDLTKLCIELRNGGCRWDKLTAEELEARKASNQARQAAGETVYIPRKQMKCRRIEEEEEEEEDGDDE